MTEVSYLSQHLCSPREGHLDDVYRIFSYLQNKLGKNLGKIAYDPVYEPTDETVFEVVGRDLAEWKDFYPASQEIMPRHMKEALGKYVLIKACVRGRLEVF